MSQLIKNLRCPKLLADYRRITARGTGIEKVTATNRALRRQVGGAEGNLKPAYL
jgi:hypothetical protein